MKTRLPQSSRSMKQPSDAQKYVTAVTVEMHSFFVELVHNVISEWSVFTESLLAIGSL